MAKPKRSYRSLREFMQHQHYKQADLAQILNMSQPGICKILRGQRRASVDLLFKLSQISGVPMEVLAVELHGRRVA